MNSGKYNLYLTVWNKYLSVIRILLKKSAAQEQVLSLNRIDFERVSGIRKSGYKFSVNFVNGRPDALFSGNDLIQTFISVLQTDEIISSLISKNDYTFTFSSKYQLSIKNNSLGKQAELVASEEETLAE
jgi:hypothetical protein